MPKIFLVSDVKIKAINLLKKEINFNGLRCSKDKDFVRNKVLSIIFNRYMLSNSTHLNRIMHGKNLLVKLKDAHPFELKAFDEAVKYSKKLKEEKQKLRKEIVSCQLRAL